jgi:hypothetical protein
LALLLIETVTVVLAPALRVPFVEESVIQVRTLEAVQLIELFPIFCNVKTLVDGVKGPP